MTSLSEYVVLFVFVVIMGAGVPGLGDAALIAAGTLAGEGKLNVGIVLATAMVAWMLGSVAGYAIGIHGGRRLLDHPGRLEKRRRNLLAKGDRAFGGHTFVASVTMPAFVSGIFRVRFWVFVLGALVAGIGWIGMYVGLSYVYGEEVAKRIGNAGTKALLGVLVIVAVGLGIRAGYSKWRATRRGSPREQGAPKDRAPLTGDPPLSGNHRQARELRRARPRYRPSGYGTHRSSLLACFNSWALKRPGQPPNRHGPVGMFRLDGPLHRQISTGRGGHNRTRGLRAGLGQY